MIHHLNNDLKCFLLFTYTQVTSSNLEISISMDDLAANEKQYYYQTLYKGTGNVYVNE